MSPYIDEHSRPYYLQFINGITASQTAIDTLSGSEEENEDINDLYNFRNIILFYIYNIV